VNICAPIAGSTVASPFRVLAGATHNRAVTHMQVYLDGAKVFETTGNQLDTNLTAAPGTHRLTVQARDDLGVYFNTPISFTVGSGTPGSGTCSGPGGTGINICTPADGATVSSPVQITAAASHTQTITHMQLYVDGVKTYETTGSSLNTSLAVASGRRRITVQARDLNGFYFNKAIYVTVP
jgi:hypothetical protein